VWEKVLRVEVQSDDVVGVGWGYERGERWGARAHLSTGRPRSTDQWPPAPVRRVRTPQPTRAHQHTSGIQNHPSSACFLPPCQIMPLGPHQQRDQPARKIKHTLSTPFSDGAHFLKNQSLRTRKKMAHDRDTRCHQPPVFLTMILPPTVRPWRRHDVGLPSARPLARGCDDKGHGTMALCSTLCLSTGTSR
jgi:hypothetical protein